ncbi:MAG: hypothetical protein Tsb0013_24240 [Phycisphaerales bacterium]
MPNAQYDHAGHIFTNEELLMAFVAERLDRLADRMVYRGHTRLGLYGCQDHIDWLLATIDGMRAFPVTAIIAGPDRQMRSTDEATHEGLPVITIDNARIMDHCDSVLIADDRYEEDMHRKAMRWLPPGIIVHRLYERLNIGRESLLRATIDRRPPAPRVIVRADGTFAEQHAPVPA